MIKKKIQKKLPTLPTRGAKPIRKFGKSKISKKKRVKRIWTETEDKQLLKLIERYGPSKWSIISTYMKNRQGKQCRERWYNHLDPSISKLPW